jgi:hypothetical protein
VSATVYVQCVLRFLIAGTLLLVTACASNEQAVPTATQTAPPIAVDWSSLSELEPVAADGFRFVDCEGDAPLLCVEERGAPAGLIELGLLDRGRFGKNAESLDALASDLERSFRADRSDGCPMGFRFEVDPRRTLIVAGVDGIRTDWSVIDTAGKRVERTLTYFALEPDRVVVFTVNALDDDGCLSREGAEFRPDVLGRAAPHIDRVVAGSKLPEGTLG